MVCTFFVVIVNFNSIMMDFETVVKLNGVAAQVSEHEERN